VRAYRTVDVQADAPTVCGPLDPNVDVLVLVVSEDELRLLAQFLNSHAGAGLAIEMGWPEASYTSVAEGFQAALDLLQSGGGFA
jgi:hypothetical protein